MSNRNLHDCIHVYIPAPLSFGHLCIWIIHRGKYRLEIPANFDFYVPEKATKLAKIYNKDRKLKRNYKTLSKVKDRKLK